MPVSFAPCRIIGYDVGAGKFTAFILLGAWISMSSLAVGGIDMNLGNWNCNFASSFLSMAIPPGVVRTTFFMILLGCAALWLGYTYYLENLSTRSLAPGRVHMRQRYIDSQFAIRGIFLSTHLALSAQTMSGGVRVK